MTAACIMFGGTSYAQTYKRTEVINYHDNVNRWVLGQIESEICTQAIPASTSCDGDALSKTTFDANFALPVEVETFGKIQQTLGYDTTSSLLSGQRGTLRTVTDGRGNTTTLGSWTLGVPSYVEFPATPEALTGAFKSATVNSSGWIESVTDETGAQHQYRYDLMGRVTRIIYPSEGSGPSWNDTTHDFSLTAAKYGLPAHWRWLTSTGNGRTVIRYDALWRPIVEERYDNANPDATRTLVVKRYDAAGRLAFQSHPLRTLSDYSAVSAGTHFEYDALGRMTKTKVPSEDAPGGWFTTTTDYLPGFVQRVTSPNLTRTTTSFMAWDDPNTKYPVAIAHPEGAFTDIARDAMGKPTTITRRNETGSVAVSRTYSYNAAHELCRTVEPETGATLMGYDDAGNLAWSAAGLPAATACHATGTTAAISLRRVDRTYDARNRLRSLDFPDGNGNQVWSYFADSKLKQISTWNIGYPGASPAETRNTYTWFNRGLLRTEALEAPGWYTMLVERAYNQNGHETSLTYPSGHALTTTVNALGQPTSISGGGITYASGITHHAGGAVAEFSYGNNIGYSMTPNDRQLPDEVSVTHGSTRFLNDVYDYDGNGNVLGIEDARYGSDGPRSRTMSYDGLDRLTNVTSSMYGAEGARYSYNVLDDLTEVQIGGQFARHHGYTYDQRRRLVTIKKNGRLVAEILRYDDQGNVSSRGAQSYRFDFGNRLREVEGVERYRYDGHGRRALSMNFNSGVVLSHYSLDGKLLYQHSDRSASTTDHVYLGNHLLAIRNRSVAGGAPTVTYQHTDALGSPVVVTRQDRTIVEETEYEPYGAVLNRPMSDGVGYAGHVGDAATGLVQMQQRYYDPGIGRFLSVDPITAYSNPVGAFNRYWYANNNPYRFFDPDGRQACEGMEGCLEATNYKPNSSDGQTVTQSIDVDISSRAAINLPQYETTGAKENVLRFDESAEGVTVTGVESTSTLSSGTIDTSFYEPIGAAAIGHNHPQDISDSTPGPRDDLVVNRGFPNNIGRNGNVIVVEKVDGQFRARILSNNNLRPRDMKEIQKDLNVFQGRINK